MFVANVSRSSAITSGDHNNKSRREAAVYFSLIRGQLSLTVFAVWCSDARLQRPSVCLFVCFSLLRRAANGLC